MNINGSFYDYKIVYTGKRNIYFKITLNEKIKKYIAICRRTKSNRIFKKNLKKIYELLDMRG